jgi:hypothetical protein
VGANFTRARIIGGVEGYTSENLAFVAAIRELSRAPAVGRKRPQLDHYLNELDRSAGRKPPIRDLRELLKWDTD